MRVRERDLLVCGRRVHCLDSGAAGYGGAGEAGGHPGDGRGAPPLVLLHGLGGCSRHWLAVMPALAERGRVIALAIFAEVLGAGLPLPTPVPRAIAGSALLRRFALWPYVRDPAALSVASATLLLDGAGARGVFPTARAIGGSDPLDGVDAVLCPILSLAGACGLWRLPSSCSRSRASRPFPIPLRQE